MTGYFYIFLLLCHVGICFGVQCLNQNGNPVDWFIVYKIPKIANGRGNIRLGTGFYYMDQTKPQLELSETGIDEPGHAVFNTLDQIYHNKTTIAYMMYNDQTPDYTNNYRGHTKGVVAFDKAGGFWLVHSTPKFPPIRSLGYSWSNGAKNGQSFICISTSYNNMETIGNIMMYNYPYIYDKACPDVFKESNPTLIKIMTKDRTPHTTSPPWYMTTKLTTGSDTFIVFAKYKNFSRDLYDSLMSEYLKEDLLVQSWIESARKPDDILPSNCSIPYKVYNIDEIQFPGTSVKFHTSKDHSKLAMSKYGGNWLCIGDINRQTPQFYRAGGQVCFQNKDAWQSYRKIVSKVEQCNTTSSSEMRLKFVPNIGIINN